MLDIFSNPFVLLLAATLLMTGAMYLFVGRKKKNKNKKIEKVYNKKSEERKETLEQKIETSEDIKLEKKTQKEEDILEKPREFFEKIEETEIDAADKSKRISKVYVRKTQPKVELETSLKKDENLKYEEMSKRAEFVKTSKTISKLNRFKQENEGENEKQAQVNEEECKICNEIKSRINHSIRLSKSINSNNFDDLFASHITEHYMLMDIDRHLSKDIEERLYNRTAELIVNGESRVLDSGAQEKFNNLKNDKDKLRFMLEQNRLKNEDNMQSRVVNEDICADEYKLSARNIVLTDAILKRKKFRK